LGVGPVHEGTGNNLRGIMPIQSSISGAERQEWRGDDVADLGRFGIIRNAALYAGFAPRTVEMFRELWRQRVGEPAKHSKTEWPHPDQTTRQGQLFKLDPELFEAPWTVSLTASV